MAVSSQSTISPLLGPVMKHRPFGVDEQDHPIHQIQSRLVIGVIRYMQIYIARQHSQQTTAQTEATLQDSLCQLVTQLNEALPDPRTHITAVDLMQTNRWYSLEFALYLGEYARVLCGDPNFYFNVGGYMIPPALITLTRPLSLRQVYLTLPGLLTRLVKTRLDITGSTAMSVSLRWYPDLSAEHPHLRPLHISVSCEMWRGALASVPRLRDETAARAKVDNNICAKEGHTDYCEWTITWQAAEQRQSALWLAVGLLIFVAAVLGVLSLAGYNGPGIVFFILFIVSNAFGILYVRSFRRALAANIQQLAEQRDFAQQQYYDLNALTANLHTINARLERRVNELTTLHQIGQMLSETVPVDQLMETSFRTLLQTLPYSGLLAIVVSGTSQQLSKAWSMKRPDYTLQTPSMTYALKGESLPARILQATHPLLLEEVTLTDADEALKPLKIKALVGIPLTHRRRPVGVLMAYYTSLRPLDEADAPLLATIGAQIAAALDNAALYDTLEQRVQQRTLELQKATSLAQAAQKERSEFIARMNHELRTPLQAIMGFGEILREDDTLTTAQHEQMQIILDHGDRLLGMIATALQVARMEAERGVLQPRRIEMKPFLTTLAQETGRSRLKIHLEAVPTVLHTDPEKLQMVLQHLTRSLHERVPGSLLHLRLYYRGRLYVEIWNEGDAVHESEVHEIMRLFTRPYNSLTTHNTGLRLSITYQVVMLLGGILNVGLQPTGGLVFRFDIPAYKDGDAADVSPEMVLPAALPPASDSALGAWSAGSLPGIMRDALRRAAQRGDLTAMQQTLDILAAQQPELAAALDEHIAQFEFEVILQWLEGV